MKQFAHLSANIYFRNRSHFRREERRKQKLISFAKMVETSCCTHSPYTPTHIITAKTLYSFGLFKWKRIKCS